jgi:hypothetical protein
MSFVESFMVQRYFIQFNKNLTREEQHANSGFALLFTGFKIAFTLFGMKGLSVGDFHGRLLFTDTVESLDKRSN